MLDAQSGKWGLVGAVRPEYGEGDRGEEGVGMSVWAVFRCDDGLIGMI